MSFDIHLQLNKSDMKQLNKTVETIDTYSGTLKSDTSIVDPVIMIECDLSQVANANYMTIPAFGNRSYFITNIRSIRNGLVEFSCHCDVLSTYKDSIRQNSAIVRRQENDWNLYLNDGSLKIYHDPLVLTTPFPQGFSTYEFVLAVAGS